MPASKKQLTTSPPEEVPARILWLNARWIIPLIVLLALGCFGYWVFADWYFTVGEGVAPTYVGRGKCIECHQKQSQEWAGSHHDLAMDLATEKSVLGDFSNAELSHFDVTSRFFKQDGKFFVNTEGPDGKMSDFEIKYVFGVDPLQQYMVEFDRPKNMPDNEIARVQVLRLAWDTRKKRWFYLPPPDVDEKLEPDDVLHWTGVAQCWNTMCADCHSTNLKKNFDHKKLAYHTTFSEMDVSCEACHGPGSLHVQLAEKKTFFWDRKVGYGLAKLKSDDTDVEIHTCAQCHSRRRLLHPEFHPGDDYYDYFANEMLSEMTYHADGQIMDEVYVHGSFVQSKMYHKGIRCSDCHNPHSLRLKHEGNQVCTSCHQHPAGKYDGPAHHFHKNGSQGASCVECHMPETTYMEVDPRRDHSLRVPRPDLSVKIGTPNACTGCHLDKEKLPVEKRGKLTQYLDWIVAAREGDKVIGDEIERVDEWAAAKFNEWYGEKEDLDKHFASVFHAARQRPRDGSDENIALPQALIAIAGDKSRPAIIRATALYELAADGSDESLDCALVTLKDRDPQVRSAALARIEGELRQLRAAFDSFSPLVNRHRNSLRQMEMALQSQQFQGSTKEDLDQLIGMIQQEKQSVRQVEKAWRATRDAFDPVLERMIPVLHDNTRLVRTEAARVLTQAPLEVIDRLGNADEKAFDKALEEFRQAQLLSNDRAGAHMSLGMIAENLLDEEAAIASYRTAMKVQPLTTGPRSHLANMLEQIAARLRSQAQQAAVNRDRKQAENLMAESFSYQTEVVKLRRDELDCLARDARLAPDIPDIHYRYGLSLYTHQRLDEAEKELLRAVELDDQVADYALVVALLYQKLERWDEAEKYAKRVVQLAPNNPSYEKLLDDIRKHVPAQGN